MALFKKKKRSTHPENQAAPSEFQHASGASTLKDVVDAQSPSYRTDAPVARPRGRATRLHPQ